MLKLELNLRVKKKAGGSGRSSKAKRKITGDKPEETQERQDRKSGEVNSPRDRGLEAARKIREEADRGLETARQVIHSVRAGILVNFGRQDKR